MSTRLMRLGLGFLLILVLGLAIGDLYLLRPFDTLEGDEVTPAQFLVMRLRWAVRQPEHYRMVASYTCIVCGCFGDVEILDGRVVRVYETNCGDKELFTVSDVFDMFERFVGLGPSRPPAADACRYSYVTAEFDLETGYPRQMETHSNFSPERGVDLQIGEGEGEFSCLAIGNPYYYATVESLTPLE